MGWKLRNIIIVFEIDTLTLCNYKILWKMKMPKCGTKNALFAYFWPTVLENYCHIWNPHPRIGLIVKFREMIDISKPRFKNALFGHLRARILKKLLLYLSSGPSNLSNCKMFWKKMKMPKFWTKNALFGYFWTRILKNYCHIENQHP